MKPVERKVTLVRADGHVQLMSIEAGVFPGARQWVVRPYKYLNAGMLVIEAPFMSYIIFAVSKDDRLVVTFNENQEKDVKNLAQLDRLKQQSEELITMQTELALEIEKLTNQSKDPRGTPDFNANYCTVGSCGNARTVTSGCNEYQAKKAKERWEAGNYQTNSKDSVQHSKWLRVQSLLRVYAKTLSEGWEPTFESGYRKYSICVKDNRVVINSSMVFNYGTVFFESVEAAERAVELIGEASIVEAFNL